MERWADRAQRRSDARAARWRQRQDQRAGAGRPTVMDRLAARLQGRADAGRARHSTVAQYRSLLPSELIIGADGGWIELYVMQSGWGWTHAQQPAGGGGPGAGLGGIVLLAGYLVSAVAWRRVYHRSYTVHVRTGDEPPVKLRVRLPDAATAYHAAAQLASRFEAYGPAALDSDWTDATGTAEGDIYL